MLNFLGYERVDLPTAGGTRVALPTVGTRVALPAVVDGVSCWVFLGKRVALSTVMDDGCLAKGLGEDCLPNGWDEGCHASGCGWGFLLGFLGYEGCIVNS